MFGRMRDVPAYLGGNMPIRSSQGRHYPHHRSGLRICLPSRVSKRRAMSMERQNDPSGMDLEESLSSALLVADKELGNVVREVDEISKALRLHANDTPTLRVAVHPAVWGAVRHMILERELRYLALTDDLTCLYNRRGFFASATQQLKLSRRNAQSLLLLFCDVDNLKQINDSYGHREGDLALVRTADALEEAFRDSDILARLGGDEFAVLALEASSQDEGPILRRLEKSLKKANANEPRYDLSLSVGVARFDPKHAVALGVLMEQADRDMYDQKRKRAGHSLSNA
jgi:diguanylate cyclase (GGDEF)-like protein